MNWTKQGLFFPPRAIGDWSASHAALPIVAAHDEGTALYFTARDRHGRGTIGRAWIDLERGQVERVEDDPVLLPGPVGGFDDSGTTGSCLVRHSDGWFLYYTGWTRGVTVPFYFYVGLASSPDGRHFTRVSPAPILERSPIDPYLTASPSVIVEGSLWRMWYVSGQSWEQRADGVRHRYHIRYAESRDGIAWRRDGTVCIDFDKPEEYAFGRPMVLRTAAGYSMWYSVRGDAYRLGYAESQDGIRWNRQDERAGLKPSATGWDSEMIAYPFVHQSAAGRFLFYNGNGYGLTGIGLAIDASTTERSA